MATRYSKRNSGIFIQHRLGNIHDASRRHRPRPLRRVRRHRSGRRGAGRGSLHRPPAEGPDLAQKPHHQHPPLGRQPQPAHRRRQPGGAAGHARLLRRPGLRRPALLHPAGLGQFTDRWDWTERSEQLLAEADCESASGVRIILRFTGRETVELVARGLLERMERVFPQDGRA